MSYNILKFKYPNFKENKFNNAKEITTKKVVQDGVAPDNFFLTNYIPTFYLYNGKWILPKSSSSNCVAVLNNEDIKIKEIRNLKLGEDVVVGRKTDGSEGIYVYKDMIDEYSNSISFKTPETSFSKDYRELFKLMEYERKNNGYIVWVLGPSVVFDYDTRNSLTKLAENGYIDCLLGGNAIATHDLEGGYLETSLGQDIYTQENMFMGHYNHLDLLNEVRSTGSIDKFVNDKNVKDGIMKSLVELEKPYVLAGSIRDDGPLPEVYGNVEVALDKMKEHLEKASLIIGLATLLHNVSVANIAPNYRINENGDLTPVYMCAVDITENVLNKIGKARGNIGFIPIITNVQDFVVNCERSLLKEER